MGFKTSTTTCRVQLLSYHRLPPATADLCARLRREAGRCWSDLVAAHGAAREAGAWLTDADLRERSKGGAYALHSQSIQALGQKLLANVATARALRQQQRATGQDVTARYPYKAKPYATVTWKGQWVRVVDGHVHLPNGRGQPPLILPLPARFHAAPITGAELLWRADHYELALTVAASPDPPLQAEGQIAGVDLGEINPAAVVTEAGQGLLINGRRLRHEQQLRNKRHAAYSARLARCKPGSRRWRRLKRQKRRASTKFYRQQRYHVHQVARKVVRFAQAERVRHLAVGDVRHIADRVDKGAVTNQKLAQWPHGQLVTALRYKARAAGISLAEIAEDYSTRTCSGCGHVRTNAPRGRVYRCTNPGCDVMTVHRDANGAAGHPLGHLLAGALWRLRAGPGACGHASTGDRSQSPDTGQRCSFGTALAAGGGCATRSLPLLAGGGVTEPSRGDGSTISRTPSALWAGGPLTPRPTPHAPRPTPHP